MKISYFHLWVVLVPYSPSIEEDASMEFNNEASLINEALPINEWYDNSIEIPDNIDDFLTDYFDVDNSTIEQGDLSPNTLQLLEDFANELTGSPPTDYILPLQTNEVTLNNSIMNNVGEGETIPNLNHFLNSNCQILF